MSTVSIRSEEILTDDTPTKTSSGELPEPPKPKPKSRPPAAEDAAVRAEAAAVDDPGIRYTKTGQILIPIRGRRKCAFHVKPKRASEQIESSVSPVRPGTSSLSGSASGTKPKLIQAKADQNVRNPPSKAVPANVFKVCSRRNRPPQSESKTSPPTTNSSSSNTVKKAPAKSTAKPASLKKTSILIPKPNTLRRTTPKAEKTEKTQVSITRSLRNYSKDDTVEIFGLAQKALVEGTPSFECRLKDFVDKCLDSSMEELKTEYELTREIYPTDRQFQCFRHPKHSFKNRYHDIYCLDNTRVVLRFPNRDEEASYVHANYVDGKNLRNKFILTQGPLMKTVGDFWRMVWQEKVSLIIMVCDHVEEDRKKCAEYLPTRERTDVANLQIKRRSQTVHKYNLTETKITLTYGNRDRHEVTHWKWLGWPDHKVPEKDVRIPFRLLQVARAHKNVIVHCSAGVGRSGTLVAMEICLMDLLAGTRLNVPDCVKFLRAKRAHAVQTFSQYLFIYRAFVDLAISLDLVTEDRIQPFLDAYEAVLCSK
ncbi:hypothetical protein L596_015607 [Steinernema carpocapsae]|nr:hypothetical protein L596_015607 [Steinernema carpocapsae]